MPDKPKNRDLEAVVTQLEKGWQELAEFLRGQASAGTRIIEAERLMLRDANGEPRGSLGVNEDGSSGLVLRDQHGKWRAWLGLKADGAAYLSLKDQYGRILFEAPMSPPGPKTAGEADAGHGNTPPDAGEPPGYRAVMARLEKMDEDLAGLRNLWRGGSPSQVREDEAPEGVTLEARKEPTPEGQEVRRRLEQVEGRQQRLKLAGVVLALLLATMAGLGFLLYQTQGQGQVGPVAAEAFVLRDPAGLTRAWLGQREGAVLLELYDQGGKVRAALGLGTEGGPSLTFLDQAQRSRAELGLGPDGDPGLSLVDQEGRLRVALGKIPPRYQVPESVLIRPVSSLVLFNQDGIPVWHAPLRWRR